LEPEKPKLLKFRQKPEVTYEKRRRTTFLSKEKKKDVIPSRIDGRDADVLQVSSNNHLLSHSAQQCDTSKGGKVASLSDTSPLWVKY
jgi:hypothetical protein